MVKATDEYPPMSSSLAVQLCTGLTPCRSISTVHKTFHVESLLALEHVTILPGSVRVVNTYVLTVLLLEKQALSNDYT